MKSTIVTFISFLCIITSNAQKPDRGVYFGLPNTNATFRDLIEYYDKGFLLLNQLSSLSVTGIGNWNIKTDKTPDILWDQTLIYPAGILAARKVVQDFEGNIYVGGTVFFNFPDIPFLAKFNPCGEQEWCVMLPKEEYGQGVIVDIVVNESEEIIVLLQYLVPGNPGILDRAFLAALSKNGELLWINAYASPNNYPLLRLPIVNSIIYHNGMYFIAGRCYYAYPSNPNTFYLRPFFIGIDSAFNEKWILPFGHDIPITGDSFCSVPINDTIMVGAGWRSISSVPSGLLMYYDINGNEIGFCQIDNSQTFPGNNSTQFRWLVKVNDESFIAAGLYQPTNYDFYKMDFLLDDLCKLSSIIARPDTYGNHKIIRTTDDYYIGATSYKTGNNPRQVYVYKLDENLQSVPFDTTTYVYDSLCPYPIQSGTIDLTDCMVLTSTDWIPTPQEYYGRIRTIPITIFPNPAKDHITFALENTEHHRNIEMRCFNLLGMQQHQTKILRGQQQASANVSAWPTGMYVVVVYSDGRPVGRGKFVVQR
jgi:hypothetical protein